MNFLISNKDNILALISIIAFLISTSQLVISVLNNRLRLSATVHNFTKYNHNEHDHYTFLITFENASSSSVSLTNLFLLDSENHKYGCSLIHKWIGERYYPRFPETDIPRTERIFSVDFPIYMEANGVRMEYIAFKIDKDSRIFDSSNKIKIHCFTNKKKVYLDILCPSQPVESFF